jgi:hypothetical protein
MTSELKVDATTANGSSASGTFCDKRAIIPALPSATRLHVPELRDVAISSQPTARGTFHLHSGVRVSIQPSLKFAFD